MNTFSLAWGREANVYSVRDRFNQKLGSMVGNGLKASRAFPAGTLTYVPLLSQLFSPPLPHATPKDCLTGVSAPIVKVIIEMLYIMCTFEVTM